jgi:hypothetical protein
MRRFANPSRSDGGRTAVDIRFIHPDDWMEPEMSVRGHHGIGKAKKVRDGRMGARRRLSAAVFPYFDGPGMIMGFFARLNRSSVVLYERLHRWRVGS